MDNFLSNCLAVECPELSLDWHPTKNFPLTTTNTPYGSKKEYGGNVRFVATNGKRILITEENNINILAKKALAVRIV